MERAEVLVTADKRLLERSSEEEGDDSILCCTDMRLNQGT